MGWNFLYEAYRFGSGDQLFAIIDLAASLFHRSSISLAKASAFAGGDHNAPNTCIQLAKLYG
jgi:hypothetical protein